MVSSSPTLEGFRAAFRRPSLTLAEVAWRWTVGGVAGALFLFYCFEFLDSVTVALVTFPAELVTTTSNVEPLSAVVVCAIE